MSASEFQSEINLAAERARLLSEALGALIDTQEAPSFSEVCTWQMWAEKIARTLHRIADDPW